MWFFTSVSLVFCSGFRDPPLLCWSISCLKGPFLYILLQHETNGEFSPQHWLHMKIIDGSLDQFRAFQIFQSQYARVLRGFANAWDLDDTCYGNTLRTHSLSLSLTKALFHEWVPQSWQFHIEEHSPLSSLGINHAENWNFDNAFLYEVAVISQPSASWDFRSAACFHSTVDRMKGILNLTLYKKRSLEIYEILHKSQNLERWSRTSLKPTEKQ